MKDMVLEGVRPLWEDETKHTAGIEYDLPNSLPPVCVDQIQIQPRKTRHAHLKFSLLQSKPTLGLSVDASRARIRAAVEHRYTQPENPSLPALRGR